LYFYSDAGELRGNCKTINVDGKELAFITLYGDKPEQLTAFIGTNNTKQATSKTFNFSNDAILGSIASPAWRASLSRLLVGPGRRKKSN
jgi:hypothetical protein